MRRGLAIVALVLAACTAPAWTEDGTAPERKAVVEGNNQFAYDLYARLAQEPGNLFFSPFSLSTALAMTHAGARGTTEAEMARALHFPADQAKLHPAVAGLVGDLNAGTGAAAGYELSVANALWGQKGFAFLPAFLDLTRAHYAAGFRELDFKADAEAARRTINDWAAQETHDRVRDLFPPNLLNDRTRLVLTNAIYFKGRWATPFGRESTVPAPFTLASGEKVQVPMMHQTATFRLGAGDDVEILALPYGKGALEMVVFLPKKAGGLRDLEAVLSFLHHDAWVRDLRTAEVLVALPRFKITSQFSLKPALTALGMKEAFTDDADFSGLDGKKDLFVAAVVHKAFVEVNEEGTEAAAASGVAVAQKGMPPEFRADRPFVFAIRDTRSGAILFLGRVVDPR